MNTAQNYFINSFTTLFTLKKTFIFLLYFTCLSSILNSQTIVSGIISENQTWTKAGNPYLLSGDLAVFSGATLVIEPGVFIEVQGNYAIYIRGDIVLQGTQSDSIIFRYKTKTASKALWKGILFENTVATTISLNYIQIKNATNALGMYIYNSNLDIKHSSFCNNDYGIFSDGYKSVYSVSIDSSEFIDNSIGIWDAERLTINNSRIYGGKKGAYADVYMYADNCVFENIAHDDPSDSYTVHFSKGEIKRSYFINCRRGTFLSPNMKFTNCEFSKNKIGIELSYPIGFTNQVTNSVFCENDIDIKHLYSYNFDLSNNCWCSNDSFPNEGIYDAYDNLALGIVSFLPYSSSCGTSAYITSSHYTPIGIDIYPNPFHEIFTVNLGRDFKPTELFIRTLDNKLLHHAILNQQHTQINIDVKGLILIELVGANKKTILKSISL